VSRIIGRVVVGISGSPENLHALRHAVELARHYDATLIAVNAQGVRTHMRRLRRQSVPWQHAASIVIRTAFDDGLGGLPRDVDCVLLAAPRLPGPALVEVADRVNDVLVLGCAQRRRTVRRAPIGVVGYCIEHAVCSVLAVPRPPLASTARNLAKALP
jgi:nucleotide-binding universal stress UspA family protein